MNKTVIVTVFVALMIAPATALYNESETYDGDMHIMAGDTGNTDLPDVALNQTGSQCMSGDQEPVRDISVDRGSAGTQITIDGTLQAANPCKKLDHSVEKNNGTHVIDIRSVSDGEGQMCVDCVGGLSYSATVEFEGEEYSLEVQHNGRTVRTLSASSDSQDSRPSAGTGANETDRTAEQSDTGHDQDQDSVIASIQGVLQGLFGF